MDPLELAICAQAASVTSDDLLQPETRNWSFATGVLRFVPVALQYTLYIYHSSGSETSHEAAKLGYYLSKGTPSQWSLAMLLATEGCGDHWHGQL